MELYGEIMDSELMNSILGSYLKPPERVFVPSFTQNDESSQNHQSMNLEITSPRVLHSPNRQALILALKTLQEKIHRLELERTQAEDNLNSLSREAAQYKKALENETNERNLAYQELIKQKKNISVQLSSAQSRCILLEKQLEYTKRMVLNVEREKNMILEQQAHLQREKEQDQLKLQAKLEKLDILEKECFKLTTTQKTAEDKIKYLEEKLTEEGHLRKLIQDKAAELQTGLEVNRILMSSVSNPNCSKGKRKSSKKTKCLKRAPPQQTYSTSGPQSFVSEKYACANLHSVNAGVQNLLQNSQHYRPRTHSLPAPTAVNEAKHFYKSTRTASQCTSAPSDSEKFTSICDNLSELLKAMQDELNQMSMEHQELWKQMKETKNPSVCEDIGGKLEYLVKKMEIKGEQISKLMKHQKSVHKLQQKVQNSMMITTSDTQQEDNNPKGSKNIKFNPRKCSLTNSPQKNSHPVRVQNLQMKLRRDDIMWEQ
ncbi:centrosomal protein CEP57L1 isoform X1 [Sorex fumeus]|uniref:centrosomal protein CEP57L1 isoform X1 n=2 Tax=Sorex fumeus TaxID=62283 RepID=UPI0024AD4FFB|nr:centrosomal protein CEP57L1 isoform X1 [Sorex fumeus]